MDSAQHQLVQQMQQLSLTSSGSESGITAQQLTDLEALAGRLREELVQLEAKVAELRNRLQ